MYSPKIDEKFIPILYKLKLSEQKPMTTLVNEIIHSYLKQKSLLNENSNNNLHNGAKQ